ncbi:hypothetical protein niasHT_013839 [Heterodera trifolii]|uniref:Uncharacterized protein n=1 Tax=Heterodera trifolii TaxID=157864 RepID=A0ABD2LEX6_9BILA
MFFAIYCCCSFSIILCSSILFFAFGQPNTLTATAAAAERATEDGNANRDGILPGSMTSSFCEHYAELALCQLHSQLAQLGHLIDLTTEEIGYLAGDETTVGQSSTGAGTLFVSTDAMPNAQKRAIPVFDAVPNAQKRAIPVADPVLGQLTSVLSSSPNYGTQRQHFVPNGWHGWMFGLRRAGKIFGTTTTSDAEVAAMAAQQQKGRKASSGTLRIVPVPAEPIVANQQRKEQRRRAIGAMLRQLFKLA